MRLRLQSLLGTTSHGINSVPSTTFSPIGKSNIRFGDHLLVLRLVVVHWPEWALQCFRARILRSTSHRPVDPVDQAGTWRHMEPHESNRLRGSSLVHSKILGGNPRPQQGLAARSQSISPRQISGQLEGARSSAVATCPLRQAAHTSLRSMLGQFWGTTPPTPAIASRPSLRPGESGK